MNSQHKAQFSGALRTKQRPDYENAVSLCVPEDIISITRPKWRQRPACVIYTCLDLVSMEMILGKFIYKHWPSDLASGSGTQRSYLISWFETRSHVTQASLKLHCYVAEDNLQVFLVPPPPVTRVLKSQARATTAGLQASRMKPRTASIQGKH